MAIDAHRGSVHSTHRAFDLTALLTELLAVRFVDAARAQDILVRETQLRAKVMRSLADASRTTVVAGPIDIVAAAELPWPGHPGRVVDDEAIVEAVAPRLGLEHRRIDPLKLDTSLVTKFCSAPFAMRHAVLPLEWRGSSLVVASSTWKRAAGARGVSSSGSRRGVARGAEL